MPSLSVIAGSFNATPGARQPKEITVSNKKYYKGLDENFRCRDYQFEVGKTYKHVGVVKACSSGFHSCENPWDVLSYYDITSRFAVVEIAGDTATHSEDSKIASAEITFKAEIKLPEFITDCINFLKDACKSEITAASGYSSQLAASGYSSKLAASGYSSKLAASGDYSIAMCAGINSKVKGGLNCALALTRWVDSEKRYRITTAYVGEDGIEADTWYSLDSAGKFIKVD